MSREIKFRVWDKTKGEMIYPSARPCIEDYYIGLDGALFWHIDDLVNDTGKSLRVFLPDQAEIMEWTGLLDANSKEIYEGDILKDTQKNEIQGPIVWDVNCYTNLPRCSWLYEVIGNIYENPELLESK